MAAAIRASSSCTFCRLRNGPRFPARRCWRWSISTATCRWWEARCARSTPLFVHHPDINEVMQELRVKLGKRSGHLRIPEKSAADSNRRAGHEQPVSAHAAEPRHGRAVSRGDRLRAEDGKRCPHSGCDQRFADHEPPGGRQTSIATRHPRSASRRSRSRTRFIRRTASGRFPRFTLRTTNSGW